MAATLEAPPKKGRKPKAAAPAATEGTTGNTTVEIPGIRLEHITIKLVGTSPLITHKWSEKAKRQMLDKQMKKAKTAKEAKDPFMDYCESMYWLDGMPEAPTEDDIANARFGFPVVGFKAAAVSAVTHVDGLTKVFTRGAFHVIGEFAELSGPAPVMREDMVRVGMGTADIRYRGEFRDWSTELLVKYNASTISPEQIVNLFNLGGFAVGVGEWRPEKDGSFGMFEVAAS